MDSCACVSVCLCACVCVGAYVSVCVWGRAEVRGQRGPEERTCWSRRRHRRRSLPRTYIYLPITVDSPDDLINREAAQPSLHTYSFRCSFFFIRFFIFTLSTFFSCTPSSHLRLSSRFSQFSHSRSTRTHYLRFFFC